MFEREEWRQVKDFEGKYEVSNLGRVKSLSRNYLYGHHGDIILSTNDRRGYRGVTLFKDGKRYYYNVHRLVAELIIWSGVHTSKTQIMGIVALKLAKALVVK